MPENKKIAAAVVIASRHTIIAPNPPPPRASESALSGFDHLNPMRASGLFFINTPRA
jgi:hypothetical protein